MRLTRADAQGAVAVTDGRAADDHRRPCRRGDAGIEAVCLMSVQPSGPSGGVIFTDPGLSKDLRPLARVRRRACFLTCWRSQFLWAGPVAGNAWRRATATMANAVAVNRDVAQGRAPAPESRRRPRPTGGGGSAGTAASHTGLKLVADSADSAQHRVLVPGGSSASCTLHAGSSSSAWDRQRASRQTAEKIIHDDVSPRPGQIG